ncbi:hypothetical protein CVT91_07580 [Candidatus Atribacteria bacterium HGW-Atribacteria-1]|nr:MAG: hypothetical protein CVT91_07580 [Candidatus Atribacteria bacterium HGW-Atribacteria-1]
MKKQNLFLVISMIFVVFLLTTGCGGSPTTPPIEEDFINIISVTPNSGLIDGVDTNFKVVVEYNLYSSNQGILQICFNDESINSYGVVENANFYVYKGNGTYEFNVTVKPKNWGSQGDFKVLVILDEVPWVSNYALASDKKILTFQ